MLLADALVADVDILVDGYPVFLAALHLSSCVVYVKWVHVMKNTAWCLLHINSKHDQTFFQFNLWITIIYTGDAPKANRSLFWRLFVVSRRQGIINYGLSMTLSRTLTIQEFIQGDWMIGESYSSSSFQLDIYI